MDELTPATIIVWTTSPETVPECAWPALGAVLNPAEQAQAGRFRFDRHRRAYVAAHALKRLMLAALGGRPPTAWRFEDGPHGKPRVVPAPGPAFNLSHCDGLVACAASLHTEVGVDVEWTGRPPALDVAESHFAPAERQWLAALPAAQRADGFFRLWTLKEAWLKATGRGLSQPLQDFAFRFDPLRVQFADPSLGDPGAWRFVEQPLGAEHRLALAWCETRPPATVALRPVQLEDLIAAW